MTLFSQRVDKFSRLAPILAICTVILGAVSYGFSLDRYPQFCIDEVVFAFPALQAAQGGAFAYAGGAAVIPYVHQIWAYHGPVLPNMELLLFKVFGYSFALSRLPEFLGGWIAVLLLVLYMNRRGYRFAGLLFAVLWCGDRGAQEVMINRMDGLALLGLVLSFLCVEKVYSGDARYAKLCGFVAGFTILIHPLCAIFAFVCLLLVFYRGSIRSSLEFLAAGCLNIPILIALWHFHPVESWAQFHFVATALNQITGTGRIRMALTMFRWSRYWIVTLVLFAGICSVVMLYFLLRNRTRSLSGPRQDLFIASAFGFAGLMLVFRSSMLPYYVTYFSVWPMLCIVILTECYPARFRKVAVVLGLIWCSSAAWNLLRLREPMKFHAQLSPRFLVNELSKDVPRDATIVTSSELYSIPIEAGFAHRGLLTFDPSRQDVCPQCYLLVTQPVADGGKFVPESNLANRKILYKGPAYPGARFLEYPVVLFAEEGSASKAGAIDKSAQHE